MLFTCMLYVDVFMRADLVCANTLFSFSKLHTVNCKRTSTSTFHICTPNTTYHTHLTYSTLPYRTQDTSKSLYVSILHTPYCMKIFRHLMHLRIYPSSICMHVFICVYLQIVTLSLKYPDRIKRKRKKFYNAWFLNIEYK